MRIALITDGIWPYVLGGMQKHSYYLCKYLAQKKVYVDLYHFNQSNYDISKLEFFTEAEKAFITSTVIDFPKSLPFPGHYIYNSYKHSKLIFNSVKEKLPSYDFIYSKGFTGWYLINQKSENKIKCAPIGVKFHGYEMFQKPPNFKIKLQHIFLLRNPVKSISNKADVVFSYGGKITEIIKSIGVASNKIVELPSGVERDSVVADIKPVTDTIKFLFLGRYERRKGIEELIIAISDVLLIEQKRKVEFHFIGPIPSDKHLQNKSVIYHGEIRDKGKLNGLIKNCDVLICPSWSEGMPNVILEAMANGLTVLATDVGAVNVLVNKNTGYLIDNSNSVEIKNCILQIINSSKEEINTKKQNALNSIKENFVWEKLIEIFLKLISKN
ncbi:MAG: glycosyltransferase family 4 protein [Bacteroidota bacterium]|nr:glycosyltransferase family 4 protein [Bacteroidota bacterium]MDP3145741.1 glycosyltransferase family 4 protein [Bacteroidota bacterium]